MSEERLLDEIVANMTEEEFDQLESGEGAGAPTNTPNQGEGDGDPNKPPDGEQIDKTYTQAELDEIMQTAINRNNARARRDAEKWAQDELAKAGFDSNQRQALEQIARQYNTTARDVINFAISQMTGREYQSEYRDPRVDELLQQQEYGAIAQAFRENFGQDITDDDWMALEDISAERGGIPTPVALELAIAYTRLSDIEKQLQEADKRAEDRVYAQLKEKRRGRVSPGTTNTNVLPKIDVSKLSLHDALSEAAKDVEF